MTIPEAEKLVAVLPKPLRETFAACYSFLVDDGHCDAYVKTIYVGFTFNGEMVSALYPHHDRLEIAMALSEDVEGAEFKDATHLTWPTMPVSIDVRDPSDKEMLLGHLATALNRVVGGAHDVRRPSDYFMGRRSKGV